MDTPHKLDEQAVQQKYMELQMLSVQIKQLQKGLMAMEEQAGEIDSVIRSLDELKGVNPGNEVLVPIANGIFVKGEIKESAELIVSVGSSVAVTKDIESTKKLLANRQLEIHAEKDDLMIQLQGLISSAQAYQEEIERLAEELESQSNMSKTTGEYTGSM